MQFVPIDAGRARQRVRYFTKMLLVMRLTMFLLTAAFLNVSANGLSQTITYTAKNEPFEKVFSIIEKQTGMVVFFNIATLKGAGKANVQASKMPLVNFLDALVNNTPLKYSIMGKTIFISRRELAGIPSPERETAPVPPVTGYIRDADGIPLNGASIRIKGKQTGTASNAKGEFTLEVNPGDVLVISFVGHVTQEVTVSSDLLFVTLVKSDSPLDEIQVIAYGQTSKRFNTGNVGTVKGEDIQKQPVNNALLALQGRVPGLFITQANGVPGGGITVRIQGQNSIQFGNDPFYVIDGVPYVSQMMQTTSVGVGILGSADYAASPGNPLAYINPSDIESIEVLKDADATAIYGSRAANGAILITTKKGKAGPVRVIVSFQQGWSRASRKLDLMNTQQYLEMRHEALRNDGITTPSSTDYDINGHWDTTRYTDWQKVLLGGTGKYTNLNVSVSGGTAASQYMLGGTYQRETTIYPGNFADKKGSIYFNLNSISLNQKFHLQFSASYLHDDNRLPSQDMSSTAAGLAPDAPALFNPDGSLNWAPLSNGISTFNNPMSYMKRLFNSRTNNMISNITLSYKIMTGLEIKSSLGYNSLQTKEFGSEPLTVVRPDFLPFAQRLSNFSNSSINSWIIEPQLSYNRSIGRGALEVLIGGSIQQQRQEGTNFTGRGFSSDDVMEDILQASEVTINASILSQYKYAAVFGRVNYNLKNRYVLNVTARRDGSSRFGPGNHFHDFGAVGGAWIFSEESFIKQRLPFFSFGKIRGSYGTTGSDNIPDYSYINLYQPYPTLTPYQGGNTLVAQGLMNPNIQWEETRKLQMGLDLGFLSDRILFTANYVFNRSSNQLLPYQLPGITGFSNIYLNFPATVENTAWELSLNVTPVNGKKIRWKSNINATIPRNKLVSFPNIANSSYANFLVIGKPLNVGRYYKFHGVNPQTGLYEFVDRNGKLTSSPSVEDQIVFISPQPKLYGGFQNSFTFKNFQLDVFLQFVKQEKNGGNFGNTAQPGRKMANQSAAILNRWQKPGDIAEIQKFSSTLTWYAQYSNATLSDANFQNASYARLKNVSLAYEFPESWKMRMGMQSCRVFFQAQNLLTFTKYALADPESFYSPTLRVMTLGVQLVL